MGLRKHGEPKRKNRILLLVGSQLESGGTNRENAILLNESGKGPFYPGDLGYPFLWTFNPRTDWKTGRFLEGGSRNQDNGI